MKPDGKNIIKRVSKSLITKFNMNTGDINMQADLLLELIVEQHKEIINHQDQVKQIELDLILGNIAKLYEHYLMLKRRSLHEKAKAVDHVSEGPVWTEPMNPVIKPVQAPASLEPEKPLISYIREKTPLVSFVVRPDFSTEPESVISQRPVDTSVADNPALSETPPLNPEKNIVPIVEERQKSFGESFNKSDAAVVKPTETELEPSPGPVHQRNPETERIRKQGRDHGSTAKMSGPQHLGLFDSVQTVADRYEEQPTLHDKISKNQTDLSLGKKLQQKSVGDLKRSIGINEKFSYINELFEGDLNIYNSCIETLNRFEGYETALKYIEDTLIPKYNWNPENKSFKGLMDLLERKFSK